MFIKVIKWQNIEVKNQPTELYHATNYEIFETDYGVRLDIVLMNGSSVTLELPSIETLKCPSAENEPHVNTKNVSVYVTNDDGKTIQTHNI